MTVYAVMYYAEPIKIWQLGDIFQKEEDAQTEANHFNLVWGETHAYIISRELQSVDVQEVKHGHWINAYMLDDKWYHTCSNCNTESVETFFDFYCPYCGAKMEFKEVQK